MTDNEKLMKKLEKDIEQLKRQIKYWKLYNVRNEVIKSIIKKGITFEKFLPYLISMVLFSSSRLGLVKNPIVFYNYTFGNPELAKDLDEDSPYYLPSDTPTWEKVWENLENIGLYGLFVGLYGTFLKVNLTKSKFKDKTEDYLLSLEKIDETTLEKMQYSLRQKEKTISLLDSNLSNIEFSEDGPRLIRK